MVSKNILQELEALGQSGEERIPRSLADEKTAWRALVGGQWRKAARGLSSQQIAALIRGLILYCRASDRQIGGSVSPVIDLYAILVERAPAWEPELTRWVVLNRVNPYEPFGTIKDGEATSYAEYILSRLARAAESRERRLAEASRQNEARQAREVQSTQRLANAVRRGDLRAIQALLGKGAQVTKALPDGASLVEFAESHGRTEVAAFLRGLKSS